jgi:hypothetical protein
MAEPPAFPFPPAALLFEFYDLRTSSGSLAIFNADDTLAGRAMQRELAALRAWLIPTAMVGTVIDDAERHLAACDQTKGLGGAGVYTCAKCKRKGTRASLPTLAPGNLQGFIWQLVAERFLVMNGNVWLTHGI